MTETQVIDSFVHAWARAEGYYEQKRIPTVAQRLHNPCNLSHWHDPDGVPYPEVCGLAEFPNDEIGFAAARSQARINIVKRQLTFMQFFAGKPQVYRGACPRDELRRFDPAAYARQVARSLQAPSIHVVIATLVTDNGHKPLRTTAPRQPERTSNVYRRAA